VLLRDFRARHALVRLWLVAMATINPAKVINRAPKLCCRSSGLDRLLGWLSHLNRLSWRSGRILRHCFRNHRAREAVVDPHTRELLPMPWPSDRRRKFYFNGFALLGWSVSYPT
jgi:hypothetical protein